MTRYILLLILQLSCCISYSQSTSTIDVSKGFLMIIHQEKHHDAIVKLDGESFEHYNERIPIDTGYHVIQAWKPNHLLITDTVYVRSRGYTYSRIDLKKTPEWKKYQWEKFHSGFGKQFIRYVPITLTAVYLTGVFRQINDYDDQLKNYKQGTYDAYNEYINGTTPSKLELASTSFQYNKNQYDDVLSTRNEYVTQNTIIGAASLALSGYLFYRSFKIKPPVKPANQNLLSRVKIQCIPFDLQTRQSTFYLTINL